MLKTERQPQYLFYSENNYKYRTENVGCKVSRPMENPQPTSKGNSTESEKPLENLSFPWQLIADTVNNCSKETRQEFSKQVKEEAEKRGVEF